VEHFLAKDFASCLKAVDKFEASLKPGKLTELYRKRAAHYLVDAPPAGFIGEIKLTEK
jgi:hypothetical protein